MKAILTTILLVGLGVALFAQEYNKPRNYSAMIVTEIKAYPNDKNFNQLVWLADIISNRLQLELNKEIPCLSVSKMEDIIAAIKFDREYVLLSGKEGNLEEIGQALGVDFIINISISGTDGTATFNGAFFDIKKGKKILNDLSPTVPDNENETLDEIDKWIQKLVDYFARQFYCPYQGTFLYSFSTKTEVNESKEWSSDDGSYSTSHTKKHKLEVAETWDLSVKTGYTPGGNFTGYYLDDYKFDSDIRGRCLKYENGEYLDIFQGYGNSSEHVEQTDELKITGLESDKMKFNLNSTRPAYFKIIFNEDSTYNIKVKAISNEALGYRMHYHQMNYSCPCPPTETINNKTVYKMLKTMDQTFGPFPGKPSDKTLSQNIEFSTPVENGSSMVIIRFELKR